MLVGVLGQEQGQITLRRVLPGSSLGPEMEISFQANGVLLGVQTNDLGTYVTSSRPDGTLFGDGQGMLTTPDGEVATWKGQGIGRKTGGGTGMAWRGAIFYQTSCERLRALNGMAVIFELDIDEQGKTEATVWEWR